MFKIKIYRACEGEGDIIRTVESAKTERATKMRVRGEMRECAYRYLNRFEFKPDASIFGGYWRDPVRGDCIVAE